MNAEVTTETLTDGSVAYGVQFEAKHGDSTRTLVTVACICRRAAERLADTLNACGAYAESDTVTRRCDNSQQFAALLAR